MKLLHQGNHRLLLSRSGRLDYPMHLHNALELVFLTGGTTTVIHDGKRIPLSAGDVFLAFPNLIHGYENSRDIEEYLMIIPVSPYLSAYHSTLTQKIPTDPVLRKGHWEHTGVPQLLELAYQDWNTASKHVIQGYILTIIGKLLPLLTLKDAPDANADALRCALLYIHEHYTQPLTRKDIAKAVGYTESHLSHMFSDVLKTSLTGYITSLRIGDALQLLSGTDLSVSQIALSLGFGSIRSFNRAFQKDMGLSPSAYRQKK